jgi:hypothetical protein
VAKELEVEIVRGGVLKRVDYDLLRDELEDNLGFGVGLQCTFDGGEELAKDRRTHRHGAAWRYEIEHHT